MSLITIQAIKRVKSIFELNASLCLVLFLSTNLFAILSAILKIS